MSALATATPTTTDLWGGSSSTEIIATDEVGWVSEAPTFDESGTQTLRIAEFCHDVRQFHFARANQKQFRRSEVQDAIWLAGREGDAVCHVDALLDILASSTLPSRIDDGIDVLSKVSPFVLEDWFCTYAEHRDETSWYIAIRAAGRIEDSSPLRAAIMRAIVSPNETLREAAAEALHDRGDCAALQQLRTLATADPSPFIRELAAELLEDFS